MPTTITLDHKYRLLREPISPAGIYGGKQVKQNIERKSALMVSRMQNKYFGSPVSYELLTENAQVNAGYACPFTFSREVGKEQPPILRKEEISDPDQQTHNAFASTAFQASNQLFGSPAIDTYTLVLLTQSQSTRRQGGDEGLDL